MWGSGLCFQAPSLKFFEALPGTPQPEDPASSATSLQEPRAAHRADGATWRRIGSNAPWELHHQRAGKQRGGFGGPVLRGDVMTERRSSPPISPPLELPVLDVASPPSSLTLRACVRAAEVAARAGRSSALLLLELP